jgi:hypothetical protein
MKKDLSAIFKTELYVDEIQIIPNNNLDVWSGKARKIVEPYYNDSFFTVILSGQHYFKGDLFTDGKRDVTKYSIEVLKYLVNREFDSSVKFVYVSYHVRKFLSIDKRDVGVTIPIDEFIQLRNKLENEHLTEDQIYQKLFDRYLNNAGI